MRSALAQHSLADCERLAAVALTADDGVQARADVVRLTRSV